MTKVVNFPKWKENATPAEKLHEMANFADEYGMNSVIIIWENTNGIRDYTTDSKIIVSESVYLLEQTKYDIMKLM